MTFFNNFFQNSFDCSNNLLEKQKKNIIPQNINDLENLKGEKIFNNISLLNEEISKKYANLINKYNEILVKPFNSFTSDYKKFYSQFKLEFSNIANNLISLKTKTNQALFAFKESSKLLQKIKKDGDNIDSNEKQRLIIENKKNEEKYKYELNQQNKLIELFNKNYNEINHNFIEETGGDVEKFVVDRLHEYRVRVKQFAYRGGEFKGHNCQPAQNAQNDEYHVAQLQTLFNKDGIATGGSGRRRKRCIHKLS